MAVNELSTDFSVTPNARLIGRLSQRSRQIDVLIDLRHDRDNSRRVIVDAKKRMRKIDVTDVEAFRGLMDDVAATRGYLVCPKGYTKAADRRARAAAVSIRLIPLDHLDEIDPKTWPTCRVSTCERGRVFWDGYPAMILRLAPRPGEDPLSEVTFVHNVGKCDRCGAFHVQCQTCRDILYLPEEDDSDYGHRCSCEPPWFWLASVEEDEQGFRSAELHVIRLPDGEIAKADRRPLQ
jgi:hypothetical protein